MKRLTTVLALTILSFSIFAQQPTYSRLKIFAAGDQLLQLAGEGIDITEGEVKQGKSIILELSGDEIERAENLGLKYEILIPDVSAFYVERNSAKSTNIDDYKGVSEWEVPENFTFGSMSGHATFDEVVENLDTMHELFPDLITQKEAIGQTGEGRDIWMVKISDNPTIDEEEPEVMYTSLHHAREPAGLMTNLFFMYYLLENYDSDPMIQYIVDNTELYFIPVINPDGYVYNQMNSPEGGGMWRKNRTDNGTPGCEGVDLNRNYSYQWGLDDIGSSPDPCEETYRGESAFSELESQAIRDFCESHELVNIMNYHTKGNLLLYAWGFTEEPCEDDALFYAHSVLYTQENQYTFGPGSSTIYPTNGGSDDWMYGEQTTKNKIFAYTPELGDGSDGFWCPIDRIIPIAQENVLMNILAAAFAGWYADVQIESFPIISETSGYLSYDVTRLGLKDGGTFTVKIEPLSDLIISGPDLKTYEGMDLLETITDSMAYTLNEGIPGGTVLEFLLTVDNGEYSISDTITRIFGEIQTVFEDDCNDMENWISPYWNVTTSDYVSPTGSITDSPDGDYPDSHLSALILEGEVDLTEAGFALLNFWAKWEIEPGYDYVQVMISDNGGTSWNALDGKYTVTGTSYQAEGQPVYDGFQTEWVQEQIELSDYVGNPVTFRFLLKSDNWVTEDGFYVDDIQVSYVEVSPVGIDQQGGTESILLSEPIPNPAQTEVLFRYLTGPDSQTTQLKVFNTSGQLVSQNELHPNAGRLKIDVSGWEAGVYIYRIEGSNHPPETGKLIVK